MRYRPTQKITAKALKRRRDASFVGRDDISQNGENKKMFRNALGNLFEFGYRVFKLQTPLKHHGSSRDRIG